MWMEIAQAVVAVVGGVINAIDTNNETDHQIDDYERQLQDLEDAYDLEVQNASDQYEMAKEEATKNASKMDKQSTFNEKNASLDANLSLRQLSLQQEAEGQAWNQQMQANDQATGNSLATMAASGTRSSSVADAVDMQAAQNSMQLQLEQDQQRNSDSMQLASVLENLGTNVFSIQTDRTTAQDLRDSYSENGWNYKLYQNELARMAQNYESQKGNINSAKDWLSDNRVLNNIAAFFGGASTGAQVASNVSDFASKLKSSDYNTGSTKSNSAISLQSTGSSQSRNSIVTSGNSDYYRYGSFWD